MEKVINIFIYNVIRVKNDYKSYNIRYLNCCDLVV